MKKFVLFALFLAAVAFTACGIEEKECDKCASADVVVDNTPDATPDATPEEFGGFELPEIEVTPEPTPEVVEETTPEIEVTPEVEPEVVPVCATNADCDDGNGCTRDVCDLKSPDNQCLHFPVTCDDDNPCTMEHCDVATASCIYEPAVCDDANPCTVDTCDKDAGCLYTEKNCHDSNNKCTTDSCDKETGECVFTPVVCDDGLNYTTDTCDPKTGACVFTVMVGSCLSDSVCNDGNPCTVDACDLITNKCQHTDVVCDDGTACTIEKCVPASVGVYEYFCEVVDVKNCDDGNPGTWDMCDWDSGACVNQPVSCDDGNVCTVDTLDVTTGQCYHNLTPGCCETSDDCQEFEYCDYNQCWNLGCPKSDECWVVTAANHECQVAVLPEGTVCGTDSVTGEYKHCDNAGNCLQCLSDANCMDNQFCSGGTCYNLKCFQDEECRSFYASGHECHTQYTPKGTACDDQNPNTPKSACDGNGSCVVVPLCTTDADCDDGNPATIDRCDKSEKAWKCVNEPIVQDNVCVTWWMDGATWSTIYGCVGQYLGGTSFDCNGGVGEWRDRSTLNTSGWNTWCATVKPGEEMLAVVNFGPAVSVNGASIYWSPAGDGQGHLLLTGETWYSRNGGAGYNKAPGDTVCSLATSEDTCLLPNGQEGANLLIRSP